MQLRDLGACQEIPRPIPEILVISAVGLATSFSQACWTKSPFKRIAKQIGTDGSVLVTSPCKPQLMAAQHCHL